MQAIWGPDAPEIDEAVPPKRQRLFIARQACEICRQKKTRCDGGHPCGLCRAAGVECNYAERKATKNEVSLGMIFNTLQRIESKIEERQARDDKKEAEQQTLLQQQKQVSVSHGHDAFAVPSPSDGHLPHDRRFSAYSSGNGNGNASLAADFASPSAASPHSFVGNTSGIHALLAAASPASPPRLSAALPQPPHSHHYPQPPPRPRHVPVIQYPIRQLANWPAIRALLKESLSAADGGSGGDGGYIYDAAAATLLEQRRGPLPCPPMASSDSWLAELPVSVVKDLGDTFFTTFNLVNPILDRCMFSQHSLGVAIHTGFGVNIESCVVLATMALGVLGRRALRAAGVSGDQGDAAPDERGMDAEDGVWHGGLVFFNEARKRIGLLNSDCSLQACQYHLLCGLFYSQCIRPIDWWAHVSRAGACCTSFWGCVPRDCDEWTMDMQARLFWITAMFEAVLTQELDVPVSNLHNYEDRVPLPKFVAFPGVSALASLSTGGISSGDSSGGGGSGMDAPPSYAANPVQGAEQDSFCHYHFLSQVAHRIILTRLCDSLFANRGQALASGQSIEAASQATTLARSDYPPQALENELLHQLEQWRAQLPGYLQWEDDEAHRYVDPAPQRIVPPTPANVFVVPWLQARYCIARYHLRRPLLHRALHHPDWMSPDDLDKCRDALACAVRWCSVIRPTLDIMDCLYLKFFICTQLFGMLLLFHALDSSPVPALHRLVPATYAAWRAFAFDFLEHCAPLSPAVARELAIAVSLRDAAPGSGAQDAASASAGIDDHAVVVAGGDSGTAGSDRGPGDFGPDRRHTRSSRRAPWQEL